MAKSDEILRKTTEILRTGSPEARAERERLEKERRDLVISVGKEIAAVIAPTLEQMTKAQQVTTDMIRSMLKDIKVEAPVMPKIELPVINVPRPNVTVKAPNVSVPPVQMPEINVPTPQVIIPDTMKVSMDQYDSKRPLPVMMMDTKGKPMTFSMGAGGGGKADFFTIKNIIDSSGASIISPDGALKVEGALSASLSQDFGSGEIGAETVRIVQATDAVSSVNVVGFTSSVAAYQTDAEGNYRGTFPVEGTVAVSEVTNSVAAAMVDSSGVAYSGSNPVPVGGTVEVSGVSGSVVANLQNQDGTPYDGDNPLPTVSKPINVRGSMATAYATISSDAATTLLAGVASTYLDLVYVMAANQSDAAVTLDLYTGAGGSTMLSLEVPANSTAGVAPATAIPMTEAAQAWYVYYGDSDVTGTTVDVTALFSKET